VLRFQLKEAFKRLCRDAPHCACYTHHNEDWIRRLSGGAFLAWNYKDVWGCIANICSTGNITVYCENSSNPDCSNTLGWTQPYDRNTIHLCVQKLGHNCGLANTFLHELFHACSVNVFSETYPPDNESLGEASAPSWIANRCTPEDCNSLVPRYGTYDHRIGSLNGEIGDIHIA